MQISYSLASAASGVAVYLAAVYSDVHAAFLAFVAQPVVGFELQYHASDVDVASASCASVYLFAVSTHILAAVLAVSAELVSGPQLLDTVAESAAPSPSVLADYYATIYLVAVSAGASVSGPSMPFGLGVR